MQQAILLQGASGGPQTVSFGCLVVILTFRTMGIWIAVGWYSYKSNTGNDLDKFYSAGKSLGFLHYPYSQTLSAVTQ